MNGIRREYAALQFDHGLRFHETDNDQLICYSKRAPSDDAQGRPRGRDPILVVVNLDPFHMQHGHVRLPLADWNLPSHARVEAHDLLAGETYQWRGDWNYVRLDPPDRVAHILALAVES